jgi:hypothetical protein
MRKYFLITAILLIALVSASFGFYDNLWTFENTGQNFWKGAIMANGHFVFYKVPDNGDTDLVDESKNIIYFPVEAGYAINEMWGISFILPLRYSGDLADSNFGLQDPWIKAKFLPKVGPNISIGPRIGIRLPFGSENHAIKRFALDVGGLLKIGYKTKFHLNAQTGIRLPFSKTEEVGGVDVTAKEQTDLYFIAEPGYLVGPKIDILGVFGMRFPIAAGTTDDRNDANDTKNTQMWFGGKTTFKVSPNVTLDGTFQYMIMNKWKVGDNDSVDLTKDFFFGIGCIATIPL